MNDKLNLFAKNLSKLNKKTSIVQSEIEELKQEDIDIDSLENQLFGSVDEITVTKDKALKQKEVSESLHYSGHRQRAKEKFMISAENMQDYELLELILFFSKPRVDVKPLAKEMLSYFKTIRGLSLASEAELEQFQVNPFFIKYFFKLSSELNSRLLRQAVKTSTIMSDWDTLIDYLRATIGTLSVEQFHVLYLDTKYRLILDRAFGTGTVDEATIYTRDIIKCALDCDAKNIIISHNHPSGNSKPSGADINLTQEIQKACESISVNLIDHIIMTSSDYFSFKAHFLL